MILVVNYNMLSYPDMLDIWNTETERYLGGSGDEVIGKGQTRIDIPNKQNVDIEITSDLGKPIINNNE